MKLAGLILGILLFGIQSQAAARENGYLLIDDFTNRLSKLDTSWEGFTDRVMGGRSDMSAGTVRNVDDSYLWMRGKVSLENNGGFIQVRLMLSNSRKMFDGSQYSGVRVRVKGSGEGYYLHLRTSNTLFPWKYYSAPLPVSSDWVEVDIPWSTFTGGDYGRLPDLKTERLKSIAVVAAKDEFDADIQVSEIGLYK